MANDGRIIIAGGGPVGLVAGLMLGRAGIDVTVFDKGDIVHQDPRPPPSIRRRSTAG